MFFEWVFNIGGLTFTLPWIIITTILHLPLLLLP